MILVKPSFRIEYIPVDGLKFIEQAGRTCYKSEDKITEDSAGKFVNMVIRKGHDSVIEHANMTVRFICDRGVTHELVRHRLCAFSQESTRYCNYSGGVKFVIPPWVDIEPGDYYSFLNLTPSVYGYWFWTMFCAERSYQNLVKEGWTPQQARSVLPNSLKTEIVVTANFREWRHILRVRTSEAAHPQMREIMIPLLQRVKMIVPVIFDDIGKPVIFDDIGKVVENES